MYCVNCGTQLPEGARFCTTCGRPQGEQQAAEGGFASSAGRPFTPPSGIQSHTWRWIGAGWRLVQADLGKVALVGLLFVVLSAALPFILQGPLQVGIHYCCVRKMRTGRFEVEDLFSGFRLFLPALLSFLLISVFVTAGLVLCVIPALVIAAMYQFTHLFLFDKKLNAWPAMKASHQIVKQDYFGFSMFVLANILLNALGSLTVIGILITVPITYSAITAAYSEIVGFEPDSAP
ncbi:MAG: zinc-ribbon domain-containing protein [Bryobacteraceae bacterium]|nr:zinc-ribbon domain-containing protein [Bryobacteraceae bacterium]